VFDKLNVFGERLFGWARDLRTKEGALAQSMRPQFLRLLTYISIFFTRLNEMLFFLKSISLVYILKTINTLRRNFIPTSSIHDT